MVAPIYLVVAMASLVDNAVGAWAPSLLIRNFGRDPAQVGVQLGVCMVASLSILPVAAALNSSQLVVVMAAVPLYFALSGVVTACGFGPTSVALASTQIFGAAAGLGPAIAFTAGLGYVLAVAALVLAFTSVNHAKSLKSSDLLL
ncbi:MAG: hypothetical protein QOF42_3342 [Gammaproteobacteria bacterium]|nr:hypothetical protein [Gammaproteobacteria bacterium]